MSKLVDIAPAGAANVYGAIASEAPGILSLAYIRGTNEEPNAPQAWFAEMARVTGADTPNPTVNRVRPVGLPIHLADICFDGILCGLPGFGNDRNLLDFIWVSVDPSGKAFGVFSSDGPATASDNSATPDVVILRQSGTPIPVLSRPARHPAVRGTKTLRGERLPGTGVGDPFIVEGAILTACAAGLGRRVRCRR